MTIFLTICISCTILSGITQTYTWSVKMATIHEYRQNLDRKLDLLEMEATALEEDLTHTHEQVIRKYDGLKLALRDSLTTVKQKINAYKSISDEQRKQLIAKIDQVQINLALGKADTEQKIKEQTKKIMTNFKSLEKEIDQCLKQKSTEFTEQMLKASDKLEAEFGALEVFFTLQSQKAKESYQNNKDKLIHQLHEFNHKFARQSHSAQQKTLQFQQEFTQGLDTIKKAFLHLVK